MKRVYLGNTELTALGVGGGGGDDTQKWVDYFNGTLTELTVPEGVTKIKESAFSDCSNLTSVTIPDSVTIIGDGAFYQCSSLTSITIPDSVTIIGDGAFYQCSSLTSITIPDSVTSIGDSAFEDCQSLTGITIPNGVTSIGYSTFGNCSKLYIVTIQNSNSKFYYNYQAFAGIASNAKLYVPSNLLSDYQADSNWTGAFKGGIYAIPIPAMKVTYTDGSEKTFYNLIKIDENTDSNKSNAKEVEIYDSVTSIGESAFENCTSLTSVTIPSTTTWIGQSIFNGCTSLSNIIYQGTMAKWNYVKFHGSWHDGVPATVVTCSDGTVKL